MNTSAQTTISPITIVRLEAEIARLKVKQHCDTCKHWIDGEYRGEHVCNNKSKIGEQWDTDDGDDTLTYSYDEDGHFNAGPKFGCVHHVVRQKR